MFWEINDISFMYTVGFNSLAQGLPWKMFQFISVSWETFSHLIWELSPHSDIFLWLPSLQYRHDVSLCHRALLQIDMLCYQREWWAICRLCTAWDEGSGGIQANWRHWARSFTVTIRVAAPLASQSLINQVFDVVGLTLCSTPSEPSWMNPL